MARNLLKNLKPQHGHRILDNFAPSEKIENPIKDFDSVPIVSIEEATDSLVSLVPDVKEMVSKAKEKCDKPKEGLSTDESAAIMLYSLEWEPREKSLYILLNNALRAEDQEQLKPWHPYLKLFIFSLEKLPTLNQTIYRGVKMDLSAQYSQGKTFVWWGFSSCTTSVQVLQSDQFLGKTVPRTLFTIECQSGKNIQKHSFFSTEDEILLVAARKFQVVSCLDSGNELFIIQLKEVESDYPLLSSSPGKNAIAAACNAFQHSRQEDSASSNSGPPRLPTPPRFSNPPSLPRFPR